jgi:hypothetical protein
MPLDQLVKLRRKAAKVEPITRNKTRARTLKIPALSEAEINVLTSGTPAEVIRITRPKLRTATI